jgi:hypothetical protein
MGRPTKLAPLAVLALLALLTLPAAACFERPIDEELEIRFPAQGGLVASSSVRIAKVEGANAALQERLARARRDLEAGNDYWSRELAALDPASERLVQDRKDGLLVRAVHRVYVKQPSSLRGLLARAAGSVRLDSTEGWSELALAPLAGSRAGEAERRRAAELVEDWSARAALYLDRAGALYRYLERSPERAEICLAPLLSVEGGEGHGGAPPPPTDEEKTLVDPIEESMKDLVEMFDAGESSAWTPDEIVRRANDPFPTQLVVIVPGTVLESEGFVVEKEGRLAVPEGGLFGAIASLEGTWIAPDPLVAYVRLMRSNGAEPLDLAAFAARPRTARGGATPAAVRRELEKALAPASSYRVRWAAAPAPPEAPGGASSAPDESGAPDDIDWDALAPRVP